MNNEIKKGQIRFNGFVKYSKKKKGQNKNLDCERNRTKNERVNGIKEGHILYKMEKEKEKINDAIEKREHQLYEREQNSITLMSDNNENYMKADLQNEILGNSTTEFKNTDRSMIENTSSFSEWSNKNLSLDDENNDKVQTFSITLKKENKKNNLSKLRDPSRKKKCNLKKNDLDNKKLLLSKSCSSSSYLPNYDNYGIHGNYYQTVYKRNKKKLKEEKYKKKYELPTIASLGKVKNLDNLDLKINEDLFSEKAKVILNNLSDVHFGSKIFHKNIESGIKLKKKKIIQNK